MTGSPTWLARYAAPNPPSDGGRHAVRDRSRALALVCGLLLVLPVGSPTLAVAGTAEVVAEEALACTARVVAAGDMNSLPANRATGLLAQRLQPHVVAVLGDHAYPNGSRKDLLRAYDPAGWGALKARTRPVPGNHEYRTPGAAGYFGYFGQPARYYAYNVGCGWRGYALNSVAALRIAQEALSNALRHSGASEVGSPGGAGHALSRGFRSAAVASRIGR